MLWLPTIAKVHSRESICWNNDHMRHYYGASWCMVDSHSDFLHRNVPWRQAMDPRHKVGMQIRISLTFTSWMWFRPILPVYICVVFFCTVQAYCTSISFHYHITTCTDSKVTDACLIISKLFYCSDYEFFAGFLNDFPPLSKSFYKLCLFAVYFHDFVL